MNPTQSLTDLPDFPYATYDEFLEAHRQGQALVWVRPDLRAAWRLGGTDDRVMYLFLFGAAWLIAAAFAFFTVSLHATAMMRMINTAMKAAFINLFCPVFAFGFRS